MTQKATTPLRSAAINRYRQPPPAAFDAITPTPVPISTLLDILAYRRCGGSKGEEAMIGKYLTPLHPTTDNYGNLFLVIKNEAGDVPNVAFTAHTDTVHHDFVMHAPPLERQRLRLFGGGLSVGVERDSCLGADDGTGVWILLNLIAARVPGLYCFFRDEETGRQGSEWSAKNHPELYASTDIMISFDRAGTTDVITHQMCDRCCSEVFAEDLAEQLDPRGLMSPDDTGSFTDSFTFIDMIPECTNVSVGYNAQHSSAETQDLTWASSLVDRLINHVAWDKLPVSREPGSNDNLCSMTLTELLIAYPEDIANVLEDFYRFDVDEIAIDLADHLGCRVEDLAIDPDAPADAHLEDANYGPIYDSYLNDYH